MMAPFARDLLERLAGSGRTIVLMIDQTQATERHQVVMVAARVGGRALPLAWRVKQTRGAIGFAGQRPALDAVAGLLPAGVRPDGGPLLRQPGVDHLVSRLTGCGKRLAVELWT